MHCFQHNNQSNHNSNLGDNQGAHNFHFLQFNLCGPTAIRRRPQPCCRKDPCSGLEFLVSPTAYPRLLSPGLALT